MTRLLVALGVAGAAAVTVGAYLAWPPAGWIVGGAVALVTALTYQAEEAE